MTYDSTGENASLIAAGTALADPVISHGGIPFVTVPDGYKLRSLEDLSNRPARKRGSISLSDAVSFSQFVSEHANAGHTHIYAHVDLEGSKFKVLAVLDDDANYGPHWKEHKAYFEPRKAKEWQDWVGSNKRTFSQTEFAEFLEEHIGDIVTTEAKPAPTAAQMLEMALSFQHTSAKVFKKSIDLNNGGVTLEFVDKADAESTQKMAVFQRFQIGIPVFDLAALGGDGQAEVVYPIEARLKYRQKDTSLVFWFELIRPDRVFKAAVDDQIKSIKSATSLDILRGWPNGTSV